MKKITKQIKYKIKGRIFDWSFNMEGQKMKKTIIDTFANELYKINKKIRPDCPLKIKSKTKEYLMKCLTYNSAVNILTQLCISKDVEVRKNMQGGILKATTAERKLFEQEIPRIISLFKKWGFKINWYITFNQSFLDSGRVNQSVLNEFKEIIKLLGKNLEDIIFFDWENEVLQTRPTAYKNLLENFNSRVSKNAFKIELNRHSKWACEEAGLKQSSEELEQDVKFQIACEAQEAKFISEKLFPEGFVLIPLEYPERYDFFRLTVPDFKENLICVLKPYPWRIK